ncbi:MAG: helix-turn-helix transcriptional regulator [Eubacteriales bacterium]|nr:helix-turn-helix transcriptional regulator [Eubacteriales bacterium]
MIRLRIKEILEEKNHTKYWLYKQMDMSYQNLSRLLNNETSSIHFENLEKLSRLLDCSISDLFEITDDPDDI